MAQSPTRVKSVYQMTASRGQEQCDGSRMPTFYTTSLPSRSWLKLHPACQTGASWLPFWDAAQCNASRFGAITNVSTIFFHSAATISEPPRLQIAARVTMSIPTASVRTDPSPYNPLATDGCIAKISQSLVQLIEHGPPPMVTRPSALEPPIDTAF